MTETQAITPTRRLILHLGVQKTGSTSLHRFLGRNHDALANHLTILAPGRRSPTRALGRAAIAYSLSPTSQNRAALAEAAQQVLESLPEGNNPVLVSHENLPGAMLGNGGTTTLYPRLEDILTCLSESFVPLQPEFVLYTRAMDDWKQSVYGQAVRSDGYSKPRAEFLEETRACGTWEELAHRMTLHLGQDQVRVFQLEDELDESRPCQQLLRHAGMSDADIAALSPIRGRSNTGLNAGALEFLRLINTLDLDRQAHRAIADLVSAQQPLFKACIE